jgi:hypothetical protein
MTARTLIDSHDGRLGTCPCCGARDVELLPLLSVLDFRTRLVCLPCSWANAEPPAVVRAVSDTTGWRAVPLPIKSAVRVHDGRDYVTLRKCAVRERARRETEALAEDEEFRGMEARLKRILSAMPDRALSDSDETFRPIPVPRPDHRPWRGLLARLATAAMVALTWLPALGRTA